MVVVMASTRWLTYGEGVSAMQHYRREHALCERGECRQKRHIVFATRLELAAHQLREHAVRARSHADCVVDGRVNRLERAGLCVM